MGDFIFGGVLAAAKESKLLGADRLNRMIECDNGASAFKLATEAGFGGVLNAFELMKAMIQAGAAAVHSQTASTSRAPEPTARRE